jgi:hypothetical protein
MLVHCAVVYAHQYCIDAYYGYPDPWGEAFWCSLGVFWLVFLVQVWRKS